MYTEPTIPIIPPSTAAELLNPAGEGERHGQATGLALSLLGNGMCPEAVSVQLRSMYAEDFSDDEISGIVQWGQSKNPKPSGSGKRFNHKIVSPSGTYKQPVSRRQEVTPESAAAAVKKFVGDFRCSEEDLKQKSSVKFCEDFESDTGVVLSGLFYQHENINMVWSHKEGCPIGSGLTLSRDEWIKRIGYHGVPKGPAGVWFRPNPCKNVGSGWDGAICNIDVTAFRFLVIEPDLLPAEYQLAFYGKLRLPIVALTSSGGRSVHALVRMDCKNVEEYNQQANRIMGMLKPFGFDTNTKNCSRLSRLPGAIRKLGAKGTGEQKLLFFSPEAAHGERIFNE